MFSYAFKTWVLANLFHPITMFIFSFIKYNDQVTMDDLGFYLIFLFISFGISIPSLILVRLLIYPILIVKLEWYEKLILWEIAIIASIIINFYGIALIFDGRVDINSLYFLIPAALAALLAVIIRIKAFISLVLENKSIKS